MGREDFDPKINKTFTKAQLIFVALFFLNIAVSEILSALNLSGNSKESTVALFGVGALFIYTFFLFFTALTYRKAIRRWVLFQSIAPFLFFLAVGSYITIQAKQESASFDVEELLEENQGLKEKD